MYLYEGTPPNERCPCKSGKAYKNCHANKNVSVEERFNAETGLGEATPARIESRHKKAAEQILGVMPSANQLLFVARKREHDAKVDDCFPNVARIVERKGGKRVLGWKLWECEHWIKAVYHAVWQKPGGELVCVSPEKNEKQALFLIDERQGPIQRPPIVISRSEDFRPVAEAIVAKETVQLRLQWKNAAGSPQTVAEQEEYKRASDSYHDTKRQTLMKLGRWPAWYEGL
jgi:hypothetical protein